MKYLRKLKNRKGFTLVELIVAMVLVGFIMVCVVAFATPIKSLMGNTNARSDTLNISKIMGDFLEKRLAYCDHVRIYTGIEAKNGVGVLMNDFKTYNSYSVPGTAGMLVIKYVAEGAYSSPESGSTYRLYDIPIKSDTMPAFTADAANNQIPPNPVFADEFYDGYEFFVTVNKTIDVNDIKNKAYLSFEITGYDFNDEYGLKINYDTLRKDYEFIEDTNTPKVKPDVVSPLLQQKTAKETITFALQNMPISHDNKDIDGDGIFEVVSGVDSGNLQILTEADAGLPGGADIVIFYHTTKYQ